MREMWAKRKIGKTNLFTKKVNKIKIFKGKLITVKNVETKLSIEYNSISEAALNLNITRSTLRNYIKNQKIFVKITQDSCGNILKEKYLIFYKNIE
jgi:hypothetical protein